MATYILKIKFKSYWNIGTGKEAGTYSDSICLKDNDKLPFISGKTLKGLFRTAFCIANKNNWFAGYPNNFINSLFGTQGINFAIKDDEELKNTTNNSKGKLSLTDEINETTAESKIYFTNAILNISNEDKKEIVNNHLQSNLYQTIQSTKIDSNTGSAQIGSLRTIEVCVPTELIANIEIEDDFINKNSINGNKKPTDEFLELLDKVSVLITEIGGKRRRGLGSCTLEIEKTEK